MKLSELEIKEQLKALSSNMKVLTSTDDKAYYGKDWTNFYQPDPSAIVFPKCVEDVQALVKWANSHQIALVPSGGRTGLSGGAVATNGEVVICLDAMNKVLDFNPIDQTVRCQAGVITEQLQNFAEEKGLYYPVDFASAGSSQIGGNIATNAGGIKVIRYGMTRDWVLGLKVVTGKGDILTLNHGLLKNATGYDLKHLFVGSEGTLGVICEATIKLTSVPKDLIVMVLGLPALDKVFSVLNTFRSGLDITAFEFFSDKAMSHVLAEGDLQKPFESETPFYALVEFDQTNESEMDKAMALFEHCVENEWVVDGVISQTKEQYQKLWALRENISESISKYMPYKNDVSVTIANVEKFLNDVDGVVKHHYPDFEAIWFGHIGDGNLHLNILKPESLVIEDFKNQCGQVSEWVFDIVKKYQGSISAEHGVGLLKKEYLHYTRTDEEVAIMRAIKAAFDPNKIMNPGKVFD